MPHLGAPISDFEPETEVEADALPPTGKELSDEEVDEVLEELRGKEIQV
ncbi:hypothetical protein ACKVMT_06145 [Halobacteriales archaeon Cl-PHB]